jgi:hypothetical protein
VLQVTPGAAGCRRRSHPQCESVGTDSRVLRSKSTIETPARVSGAKFFPRQKFAHHFVALRPFLRSRYAQKDSRRDSAEKIDVTKTHI